MKYKIIIIVFSVILMGLSSCNSCTAQKQNDHNYEECTEHDHNGHSHSHVAPAQESFKVEADSAAVKHTHDHDHSDHNH